MTPAARPRRLTRRAGLSLAETAVALGLLAAGLLGALAAITAGLGGTEDALRATQALALADQRLEALRARAAAGAWAEVADLDEPWGSLAGFPSFRRTTRVTAIGPDLKEVRVEVAYRIADREAVERVTLATRLDRP